MLHNSTIQPKKKLLDCGHNDYNFSKGRCRNCAMKDKKPIAKMSEKRLSKLEEDDLQGLIEENDLVFSKLVRIKYADSKGIVACYTCGAEKHWTLQQCGHFIPRANLGLRWEISNCKPQCVGCNCLAHGKMDIFEKKLDAENKGIVEWLREQGNQVCKPTRMELKELLCELRNKLRIAQSKLIHH